MAARFSGYAPAGRADPARTLRAAAFDFAVSAVAALILWPFPLVRVTLRVPPAAHVVLVVAWMLLVYVVYMTLSVALAGRTAAMYFLDLGLEGKRPFPAGAAFGWALGWAVALVPALLGARRLADPRGGLPARFSGLTTTAASEPQR